MLPDNSATAQRSASDEAVPGEQEHAGTSGSVATGLTLAEYAGAKKLSVDFLRSLGISDCMKRRNPYRRTAGKKRSFPAVRIPYRDTAGKEIAVRYRMGLTGERFRWRAGDKPVLYGQERLAEARQAGEITIVEGESDCQTLWQNDICAIGVPGADCWNEERDAALLDGFETIYVVIEPDKGGERVREWVSRSRIRDRVRFITLAEKDASAHYMAGPASFKARWEEACRSARSWSEIEDEAGDAKRAEAWHHCEALAKRPDILDQVVIELGKTGLVGESRTAKLLYLALTSRFLSRPVSIAVKGPSSGGKSFLVETVLRLFPESAYLALTAMSDRALAFIPDSLRHRFLVLYEAAGMTGDIATYMIRSLLSEGRIDYMTVEKTTAGLSSRKTEIEGPTGLIVTATSHSLHAENETRLISVTVSDTREHTAAVLASLAREGQDTGVITEVLRFHALQEWLATAEHRVVIPFAERLADQTPPASVRLRRDFKALLNLIKANAILHQASRGRDEEGRIIASIDDYIAVRALVADLMAEGVEVAVTKEVRETVDVVGKIIEDGRDDAGYAEIGALLGGLDKSSVSRRVRAAIDKGFLMNREDKNGRPARIALGAPIPVSGELLPHPESLILEPLHRCADAANDAGSGEPRPEDGEAAEIAPLQHCAVDQDGWPVLHSPSRKLDRVVGGDIEIEPDQDWSCRL